MYKSGLALSLTFLSGVISVFSAYAQSFSGTYRLIDGTCRSEAIIFQEGTKIYLNGGRGSEGSPDEVYIKVTSEPYKFYYNGNRRSSYIVFYPPENKFVFTSSSRSCTFKSIR